METHRRLCVGFTETDLTDIMMKTHRKLCAVLQRQTLQCNDGNTKRALSRITETDLAA